MKEHLEHEKTPEARIAELEKYVTRLRIGLIAVASLILWQATSEMGWLGPIRLYATEVYASQFILEDEEQKVYGRWELAEDGLSARFVMYGEGPNYLQIDAEGVAQREDRELPASAGPESP